MRSHKAKSAGDYEDPVPVEHAASYARQSYRSTDNQEELVNTLKPIGASISGWKVLDLGGGPGQFTALLAQQGANVTWHDVSRNYEALARQWCQQQGVDVAFEVGRLGDLRRYSDASFDFVFNRLCWYYAEDEKHFYEEIRRILKPGGYCYVRTPTAGCLVRTELVGFIHWGLYLVHELTGVKLAHVPARAPRLRKWFAASGDFELTSWTETKDVFALLARKL